MNAKIKSFLDKYKNLSLPVKASVAFVLCSFFQRGISTITTPIFTRLLTTEEFGYYTIFNSWLEIVGVFSTLKLSGSVFTQALVKFDGRRDELTSSTASLGTVVTLIVLGIYLLFRGFFNELMDTTTMIMVCIFLASWSTLMFELWAVQLRVQYKYKPLVALTIISSVLKPVAGICAILCTDHYKAEARIISLVAVEIVVYSWLFVLFLKRSRTFFNKDLWKYSLSLNIPLIPHYLTRVILNQSDRLMIKEMVSYDAAGIYGLAHSLAWLLTLITSSLMNTLNPWFFQKIKDNDTKRIGSVSYAVIALVGACGLAVTAVSPEIVRIFAPKEYYEAIWAIPPLVASVFFMFIYNIFAVFEYYFEKSSFLMIASTVGGVLNIILNYFFIKQFGYIAAGYTTLGCYIFYAIAHYICMNLIIRKQLNNAKIFGLMILIVISVLYMVLSGAIMLTYNYWYIRYAVIVIGCLAAILNKKFIINILKEIRSKSKKNTGDN